MEFNFEREIKCVCGTIYEITDFKEHFKECPQFKECFGSFDDKLSKLIKSYSQPKEQLILIRFLFGQYIKILDKKIKGNFVEISKSFKESFINSLQNDKYNNNNEYGNYFSMNNNKNELNDINYEKKFFFNN